MTTRPHPLRRTVAALACAALGCAALLPLAHGQQQASTWPTKPVRIVVPFAPGGTTDILARAMAPELSRAFGQQFIVDNRAGAGGNVGADIVATVDDDNVPLPGWGEELFIGLTNKGLSCHVTPAPAFDPIGMSGYPQLWHRGFPLPLVATRHSGHPADLKAVAVDMRVDIQADFWNGDPDVDAICRMIHAPNCCFDDKNFPFTANKMGPFNSQNTFLSARVLKDYFMFPFVGRMDDIWPSYYVQALGYKVVWNKASVRQVRLPLTAGSNPNAGGGGLIANMKGEYLGYEHNLEIVTRLPADPEAIWEYCPGRTRRAFELYRKHFK